MHDSLQTAISHFVGLITCNESQNRVPELSECIKQIEDILCACSANMARKILNESYFDQTAQASSPLIAICMERINTVCHDEQLDESALSILCTFVRNLIRHGLRLQVSFSAESAQSEHDHNPLIPRVRHFNVINTNSTFFVFSALTDSIDCCHHDDQHLVHLYQLLFDLVHAMEEHDDAKEEHTNNDVSTKRRIPQPAMVTLPLWQQSAVSDLNGSPRNFDGLVPQIWLYGHAVLSMFCGYSPAKTEFEPRILQLTLEQLMQKAGDQQFFTFIDMDTQNTTTQYHRLLPMVYDHQFVLETTIHRAHALRLIRQLLHAAYHDLVHRGNRVTSHHYYVLVYLFVIKAFYTHYQRTFNERLETVCKANRERIALLYEIVQRCIINAYCFEDVSPFDRELDRAQWICFFVTQMHKFSQQWQDWMAAHMLQQFTAKDRELLHVLLVNHPHIQRRVVACYKNHKLTAFALDLYGGYLRLEQMIQRFVRHQNMNNLETLKIVLNADSVHFYVAKQDGDVAHIFRRVVFMLILFSHYKLDEAAVSYVLRLFATNREMMTQIAAALRDVIVDVFRFRYSAEDHVEKNNIYHFFKSVAQETQSGLFAIDLQLMINEAIIQCREQRYEINPITLQILQSCHLRQNARHSA
mmetsp:Transcript_51102/g.81406  ORF Transcript_51102/g.81406 Transcript_51102/m.81406 type:complete len:640 (+) Transcript_51102:62-1981(+)